MSELRVMPEEGFTVAFSFAGEQREMVREIALECEALLGRGKVFFDEWFEHVIGGFDADTSLQSIYGDQTQMVVLGVSGQYRCKPWTQVEFRAIRARFNQLAVSGDWRDRLRFLPIRVGDGALEGTFPLLDIALEVRGRSAGDVARIIAYRLAEIDTALVTSSVPPRATVLLLPCEAALAGLSQQLATWLEIQDIAVLRPDPLLPERQRLAYLRRALDQCAVVVEWFQNATQPADLDFVKCHDEACALNAALPREQRRPALMYLPPDGGRTVDPVSESTAGKRMLFESFKKTVLETALAPPVYGLRKVVISAARADQEAVRRLIELLPPERPLDAQYDELHQSPDFGTGPDFDERLHKAIRRRTGSLVVVNGACRPSWAEERLRVFDQLRENMPLAPQLVVWDVPQPKPKARLEFRPDYAARVDSADPAPVAEKVNRDASPGKGGDA